jgi:predicted AAA+ superfamily ATPase
MIQRLLEHIIQSRLHSGKAILLLGPRQVGKTTLLKKIFPMQEDVLWLEGDEKDVQDLFEYASASRLKAFFGTKKTVIIDEAQRIKEIGLRMKLITDQIKEVQLIATGSSAFELANHLNEPLTGRKWEYKMYSISFEEMVNHHGLLEEKRLLPHRLVYGYYPEVVTHTGKEKDILKQLSDSYLYKDVLLLEQIKKPEAIVKLLQALAYQIGSQVSYNELSNLTGLDAKTVEKYIYVLEQTYVIFRLGSFSRNLRSELKKSRKIYFYDNGIRNALIANFTPIESRMDAGALWENFLMSERKKHLAYHQQWSNTWYWRTKEQNEIDYIEEEGGLLRAYEFKWNPKAKAKLPKTFSQAYPNSQYVIIHPQNVENFLLKKEIIS